jgi:hypothetical protein
MRFTVFGCSRRNRAASMQSQTGSIVADAIFIEHSLSNTVGKSFWPPTRRGASPCVKISRNHNAGDVAVAAFFAVLAGEAFHHASEK